jgi:hypothetical protein
MSTWRYFVTDEQLNAKNWQMVEEGKALKKRLKSLEDELGKFSASWMAMGRECSTAHGRAFRIGEREIGILNPSRSMEEIETIPWKHFDAEAIKALLGDLQRARQEFEDKNKFLRSQGIELSSDAF